VDEFRSHAPATAAGTALLTMGVAALAWAISELSNPSLDQPDYFVRPIGALVDASAWVALAALLVAAAGLALLVRCRRGWAAVPWRVVCPVVAIGAVIGGGYAVLTAPTIGANIGAGLVIIAAPVLVVVLGVVAVAGARRSRNEVQRAN
jgi:hypothetical protein